MKLLTFYENKVQQEHIKTEIQAAEYFNYTFLLSK